MSYSPSVISEPGSKHSSEFLTFCDFFSSVVIRDVTWGSGWKEAVEKSGTSELLRALIPHFLNPERFGVDHSVASIFPPELCRSRIVPLIGLCLESMLGHIEDLENSPEPSETLYRTSRGLREALTGRSISFAGEVVYSFIDKLLAVNYAEDNLFSWETPCFISHLIDNAIFVEVVEVDGFGKMVVSETMSGGAPFLSFMSPNSGDLFSLDEMMGAGFLRRGEIPPEIEKVFELTQLKGFIPVSFPVEGSRNFSLDLSILGTVDHICLREPDLRSNTLTDERKQAYRRFGSYPVFYRGNSTTPLFRVRT